MTEDPTRDRMFELHTQNDERSRKRQKGAKIMNEYELIDTARGGLNSAERAINAEDHTDYAKHMSNVLDLLIEELVGGAPEARSKNARPFNPDEVLADIALAVKHRTISTVHRWNIVYYYERITCVPTYVTIPSQIILHEFTERMVSKGFSVTYWNQLKTNVIKLYKELHK